MLFATINEINEIIHSMPWIDFEIDSFSIKGLDVLGYIDYYEPYKIKIHFHDVFAVLAPVSWKTNTTNDNVLYILEGKKSKKFNIKHHIEVGYIIFQFVPEDYPGDFNPTIVAKQISYELHDV